MPALLAGLPAGAQLMWCAVSVIGMMLIQPHNPRATNPQLTSQLQEFAWTEGQLEARMQVRQRQAQQQLGRAAFDTPACWLRACRWCLPCKQQCSA